MRILKFTAQASNVVLVFKGFEVGRDRKVLIDKMRTQQILINLIQNAIKFSNDGDEVIVSLEQFVVANPQKSIGVYIRVTDKGIGLSEADRKDLFRMNFRTDNEESRRKNPNSHGIGLRTCKKFAQILGGDLACTSEVGEGG